jgi:hypothetical protein
MTHEDPDRVRTVALDSARRNLHCAVTALQVAAEGEPDEHRFAALAALHAAAADVVREADHLARL